MNKAYKSSQRKNKQIRKMERITRQNQKLKEGKEKQQYINANFNAILFWKIRIKQGKMLTFREYEWRVYKKSF